MKTTVALIIFLSASLVAARNAEEQARIDYLINSLGELRNAVFIRNGSDYHAAVAQDHLRQKLRLAGDRVQTAEQFISYCATESSMTRRLYQIRFNDGKVVNTADYFTAKLREYDQARLQD